MQGYIIEGRAPEGGPYRYYGAASTYEEAAATADKLKAEKALDVIKIQKGLVFKLLTIQEDGTRHTSRWVMPPDQMMQEMDRRRAMDRERGIYNHYEMA